MAAKLVDFNGKLVETIGYVIEHRQTTVIVDFEHDGVQFRGEWNRDCCIFVGPMPTAATP